MVFSRGRYVNTSMLKRKKYDPCKCLQCTYTPVQRLKRLPRLWYKQWEDDWENAGNAALKALVSWFDDIEWFVQELGPLSVMWGGLSLILFVLYITGLMVCVVNPLQTIPWFSHAMGIVLSYVILWFGIVYVPDIYKWVKRHA